MATRYFKRDAGQCQGSTVSNLKIYDVEHWGPRRGNIAIRHLISSSFVTQAIGGAVVRFASVTRRSGCFGDYSSRFIKLGITQVSRFHCLVIPNRFWRSLSDQLAEVQHKDLAAQPQYERRIVFDEQQRRAFLFDSSPQCCSKSGCFVTVQTRKRFVEEYDSGLGGKGSPNFNETDTAQR